MINMEIKFAKQRIIKDIKNTDERIQVTGYIKKFEENFITLDDESGQIQVNITNVDFKFQVNDLVNVIGNIELKSDGKYILQAEIIQDMNNLNFKYYQQLYQLKKELDNSE